tara:strand:+ start:626 stop:1363 length:738 start_codon:yes stop_codon:yes gene_type:complete
MQNILPQQAGLTVGNVIYRYTAVKNIEDDMLVHVQNEDALGTGYIFRETDDWSGLEGTKIYKVVPTGGIPLESLGAGSIEVEGTGSVIDPSVIYTYKYDPCFDPQSDPTCPGYQRLYDPSLIPVVEFNDPLQDALIMAEMEKQAKIDEEEEHDRKKRISKVTIDLEKMLGGLNRGAMDVQAAAQEAAMFAMNYIPLAYTVSLNGGVYKDMPMVQDSILPKSNKAKRLGLAQQKKHEEMVRNQYDN